MKFHLFIYIFQFFFSLCLSKLKIQFICSFFSFGFFFVFVHEFTHFVSYFESSVRLNFREPLVGKSLFAGHSLFRINHKQMINKVFCCAGNVIPIISRIIILCFHNLFKQLRNGVSKKRRET